MVPCELRLAAAAAAAEFCTPELKMNPTPSVSRCRSSGNTCEYWHASPRRQPPARKKRQGSAPSFVPLAEGGCFTAPLAAGELWFDPVADGPGESADALFGAAASGPPYGPEATEALVDHIRALLLHLSTKKRCGRADGGLGVWGREGLDGALSDRERQPGKGGSGKGEGVDDPPRSLLQTRAAPGNSHSFASSASHKQEWGITASDTPTYMHPASTNGIRQGTAR